MTRRWMLLKSSSKPLPDPDLVGLRAINSLNHRLLRPRPLKMRVRNRQRMTKRGKLKTSKRNKPKTSKRNKLKMSKKIQLKEWRKRKSHQHVVHPQHHNILQWLGPQVVRRGRGGNQKKRKVLINKPQLKRSLQHLLTMLDSVVNVCDVDSS
jgi:hypothetical protein